MTTNPVSPRMKSRVPSIGSTIQTRGLPEALAVSGISSDRTTSSGNASRKLRDDERVGGVIGVGDRLVAGLALDTFSLLAVIAAHQHGRLARDAGGDLQLAGRSRRSRRHRRRLQVAAQRRSPGQQHQPGYHQQQAGDQHRHFEADAIGGRADEEWETRHRRAGGWPRC